MGREGQRPVSYTHLDVYKRQDDEMKTKSSVDWNNKSTADIIGDLAKFVKLGKDNNLNLKFEMCIRDRSNLWELL